MVTLGARDCCWTIELKFLIPMAFKLPTEPSICCTIGTDIPTRRSCWPSFVRKIWLRASSHHLARNRVSWLTKLSRPICRERFGRIPSGPPREPWMLSRIFPASLTMACRRTRWCAIPRSGNCPMVRGFFLFSREAIPSHHPRTTPASRAAAIAEKPGLLWNDLMLDFLDLEKRSAKAPQS